MVSQSQTGSRVVISNSCKGPVYPGKGPKKSQRQRAKKEPKAKGLNENLGASNC